MSRILVELTSSCRSTIRFFRLVICERFFSAGGGPSRSYKYPADLNFTHSIDMSFGACAMRLSTKKRTKLSVSSRAWCHVCLYAHSL
jgi:hypothetical protein